MSARPQKSSWKRGQPQAQRRWLRFPHPGPHSPPCPGDPPPTDFLGSHSLPPSPLLYHSQGGWPVMPGPPWALPVGLLPALLFFSQPLHTPALSVAPMGDRIPLWSQGSHRAAACQGLRSGRGPPQLGTQELLWVPQRCLPPALSLASPPQLVARLLGLPDQVGVFHGSPTGPPLSVPDHQLRHGGGWWGLQLCSPSSALRPEHCLTSP